MTSECALCGKEFGTDAALQQHHRDRHGNDPQSKNIDRGEPKRKDAQVRVRRRYGRRGRRKTLLVVALPILIAVIVGGVYFGTLSPDTSGSGISGTKVGQLAPDFGLTLTNGTTTYLSSYEGHPTLLWFVSTWCSSCIQGTELLRDQYYSTFNAKGLQILEVELYRDLNQSTPASCHCNNITDLAKYYGGGLGKPGWDYGMSDWKTTQVYDPLADLDIFYLLDQHGAIVMTNVGAPNYMGQIASQSFSNAANPPFPFQCLAESTTIHIHPYLRIVINGQNITVPAAIGIENPQFQSYQVPGTTEVDKVAVSGSCFEPMHTHDASGIIHIESSGTGTQYTLGDFFRVWQATYGTVTIDGAAHPIVFNPTDVLGFRADATHQIILLVDGKPSTAFGSLVLNQLDFCSAATTGPPCAPTAVGDPYYNGQTYPFGTGHTITIEYVSTGG